VEQREDFRLRRRLKIDQQIASADQIHSGERRIAEYIVLRKRDDLA
jgi:hypothetical protein